MVWLLISILRMRKAISLFAWIGGFVNGILSNAGEQEKLSWRALFALGRAGRFPII
jgi:hypothetical protein